MIFTTLALEYHAWHTAGVQETSTEQMLLTEGTH